MNIAGIRQIGVRVKGRSQGNIIEEIIVKVSTDIFFPIFSNFFQYFPYYLPLINYNNNTQ